MSDKTELRAAFEKFGNETLNYGFHPETWDAVTEEYTDDATDMAWIFWQGCHSSATQHHEREARDLRDTVEWLGEGAAISTGATP